MRSVHSKAGKSVYVKEPSRRRKADGARWCTPQWQITFRKACITLSCLGPRLKLMKRIAQEEARLMDSHKSLKCHVPLEINTYKVMQRRRNRNVGFCAFPRKANRVHQNAFYAIVSRPVYPGDDPQNSGKFPCERRKRAKPKSIVAVPPCASWWQHKSEENYFFLANHKSTEFNVQTFV